MERISDKIPFETTMSLSQAAELERKFGRDEIDFNLKQKRIQNSMNNPDSNIRKVGDYLWEFARKNMHKGADVIVSHSQISKDLKIIKNSVRIIISQLNSTKLHPFTWIPVPKKKGYIQSVLKSELDYDKWDRKKGKTIMTMQAVRDKAENIVEPKRKQRERAKLKIKSRE